jgi:hypothetical protein
MFEDVETDTKKVYKDEEPAKERRKYRPGKPTPSKTERRDRGTDLVH